VSVTAKRVELTHAAVDSLRSLSRGDRSAVVARIDRLAAEGLPVTRGGGEGEVIAVPVGDRVLFCVEDATASRIIVISVERVGERDGRTVTRLVGRTLVRWVSELSGGETVSRLVQDLRFSFRSLRRSPGFSLAAVLTLALGIGSAAAIFSVANGVLLKPLPWGDPDGVVTLWTSWDNFPDRTWLSVPEYQLFRQENRTLEDLALYETSSVTFTTADSPERVKLALVTPNLFDVLGVTPAVGRAFTWREAEDGSPGVLLSWEVWQRRYGGDRSIIGRTVELDGRRMPVLGVLPEGFMLPVDYSSAVATAVYYPEYVDVESPAPDLGTGGSHGYYGVGRLRAGTTLEAARADLGRIMKGVEPIGLYSPERRFAPRLFTAKADVLGPAGRAILILLGAVGFVLLIACSNVANLLFSRSELRTGEVAVRVALGARRGRIVRQFLTENVVLAGIAGLIGYALARVGVGVLLAIDPRAVPRASSVTLDGPVVLFTVGVSLLTVMLFGVVPAIRSSRAPGTGLRRTGRTGRRGPDSNRMQGVLVALQMAMAVILLAGSGLMVRTFVSLLRIDPGFGSDDVLTLRISASGGAYADAASIARFHSEVVRRIREIPGVRSAGAARLLPLASTMGDSYFRPVGYQPAPNESTQGDWQWATPGYIETMRIPLLEGRTFDARDGRGSRPVVMINEVTARRYWGRESPIGKAVVAGGTLDTATVVGVVGNVSHNGLTADIKTRYYVPIEQVSDDWTGTMRSMTLMIGTDGSPGRWLAAVRQEIRAIDPSAAISEVKTLDQVLSESVAQPRFAVVLLGAFATVALALALIGIYSVLAYGVSKRTQEIGIRLALGAKGGQVVGLVVRQGMVMAFAGIAAGTGAALLLSKLMSGLLYGVAPRDPTTFLVVPAVFVAVAAIACLVPAVRAARVGPARALRYD